MDEVKERLPGHDGRHDGGGQQRLRGGRDREEEQAGAGDRVKGAVGGAMRSMKETFSGDDDQEDDGERQRSQSRSADESDRNYEGQRSQGRSAEESDGNDEGDRDDGRRQPAGSRRAPQGRQAPSRG